RGGIQVITQRYLDFIGSWERIGRYKDKNGKTIDILVVKLRKEVSLYRARTAQRNFVAEYLQGKLGTTTEKDAALVAFISPDDEDWRFSLVKLNYRFEETPSGKVRVKEEFTPARRWSFLVGKNEKSHTAQSRFLPILENDEWKPALEDLEKAFDVEIVTKEFFDAYRYALREVVIKSLSKYDVPFEKKHSFAQLLLSRIMFLYFLQRKGWFKWKDYVQDKNYIKNLWLKYKYWRGKTKDVFYSQWLSSLFFGALNKKTHLFHPHLPDEIKESFSIMPFLNGGLFSRTELDELKFDLPDSVFECLFEPDSYNLKKGFLETFNFTIDESMPVDVEVAVDPEMLGKVYESIIAEEERGEAGIFYTPRVEIDFMCRMSLVGYLSNEIKISKEKIIDFIFEPHNKVSSLRREELSQIKEKLDKLKVVDPAVGSASFLVGMMNILVELHQELINTLEKREENLFALKQKIILENLYGVDVKDWAVMVGELRLWLSLIIETDEKYMDIYTKPLLPNLFFKIRQGDSLIQEIAGIPINLKSEMFYIPISIRNKITEVSERKSAFFSGLRSADLKELKEIELMEQKIFKEIIQSKIDDVKKEINKLEKQVSSLKFKEGLFGDERTEKEKKQIKKLEKEIEKYEAEFQKYASLLQTIGKKTQKDYFLWELDFVEVFSLHGGFDIVIGNPPYVRQELIAPPLESKNKYSEEQWREIKKEYKEKLIQSVKNIWNNIRKIDKKSDLYVYFYYQGLSLLCPGGTFCFINSNSWLDVGYGAGLQEFLLKNMRPLYVFDNLAKRSFKQADVNTVIVLIQRPENKLDDYTIKFVAFKKPFEDVLDAEVIKKIESANQPIFDDENFRIYPKTKKELLIEGVETPEEERLMKFDPEYLSYIGNNWGGKYLRAPEIYFKILEKGKGKLVRLGDIADLQRGLVTGLDTYIFLSTQEITAFKIEKEFIKKVLVSPRQLNSCIVLSDKIETYAIYTDKTKQELKGTNLLKYIELCEEKGALKRATAKKENSWFIIKKQNVKIPCISLPRAPYTRFTVFLIIEDILVNDMVIIEPHNN
ncbi:MAG TPA: Eco57I restriction-modification methylase domain-containing protein, partial [bacterium]|nr:Eco57I restriction-modification methylase domain-containing protein [bacterium]